MHGKRLGGGGGRNAVFAHHIGKVGRCAGGQGQCADGQDGKLGLCPHEREEALALLHDDFAGNIGIALAEGCEGAGVVHCAPGLPFGIGGCGAHGLVVHHGQHTLHGGLEIADAHSHGVELRRTHGIHTARQQELDGGLDRLVHIAILDAGVPENTEVYRRFHPADGALRYHRQGRHLNGCFASGVILHLQFVDADFARGIGDDLERINLHGGAVRIHGVGTCIVLHDFQRGVFHARALLDAEKVFTDIGIHQV